ncbi:MAG: TetR/AcrR family transcriptional regulator [Polyangiaceae bacterium]|nr:TetR/AcrR family transcriptional regulator [Polyangiaceae bacterium]MCW5792142.1 TetR/AcrR family transcriptional regulator [Polyangiaceae bacterium]
MSRTTSEGRAPLPEAKSQRPQQARAVATRKAILNATLEALVELGYARTTTAAIGQRAGVSQGALFKHFQDKAELMGAATEHLFDGLVRSYRDTFLRITQAPDRLEAAIELLWGVFTDGPLQAAFELYVAARTDPALRATLSPVLTQHRENVRVEAALFFPEAAKHPDFRSTIDGVMAAMQGAALSGMVLPQPRSSQGELAFIRRAARAEFARALGQWAASAALMEERS